MNASSEDIYKEKISHALIAGQVIGEFIEGVGFYISIGTLFLIWTLIRQPTQVEIRREYT